MMGQVLSILKQPMTHEWETPQNLFDTLDQEFHFVLDAAASSENAKCSTWYEKGDDTLSMFWEYFPAWCNPPYGTQIPKWVRKGYDESRFGTVVMLIPSRTDTAWWHKYVMKAKEVRFVCGRLRFSGATTNAPFPSCVVVFAPGNHTPAFSTISRSGLTPTGDD